MEESEEDTKIGLAGIKRFSRPFEKEIITLAVLGLVSAVANGSVPYII